MSPRMPHSRLDTSSATSAYMAALDLATSLTFRPGASKMAVLLHCSSCPVDQAPGSVLERLTQLDMSVHVLQQDMILGKRGRAVSKAIGLEKSGAYPRKRLGRNTLPSPSLLDQVDYFFLLSQPRTFFSKFRLFSRKISISSTYNLLPLKQCYIVQMRFVRGQSAAIN